MILLRKIILSILINSIWASDVDIACDIAEFISTCYFQEIQEFDVDISVSNEVNFNITIVRFLFSYIHHIPIEIFSKFPNIDTLFARSVNLHVIDLNMKQDYTKNFTTLRGDYNKVTKLDNRAFLGVPFLEKLSLRHNKIDYLEDEAFYGLDNLRKLFLSYNKIHNINDRQFRNLGELISLHLDNNKIEVLEEDLFSNNFHLKIIHLENNKITSIAKTVFHRNVNLKILYLNDNCCIENYIFMHPQKNLSLMDGILNDCYNGHSLFWKGKFLSYSLLGGSIFNFVFGVAVFIIAVMKRRKKKRITFCNTGRGISIIARPY